MSFAIMLPQLANGGDPRQLLFPHLTIKFIVSIVLQAHTTECNSLTWPQ